MRFVRMMTSPSLNPSSASFSGSKSQRERQHGWSSTSDSEQETPWSHYTFTRNSNLLLDSSGRRKIIAVIKSNTVALLYGTYVRQQAGFSCKARHFSIWTWPCESLRSHARNARSVLLHLIKKMTCFFPPEKFKFEFHAFRQHVLVWPPPAWNFWLFLRFPTSKTDYRGRSLRNKNI